KNGVIQRKCACETGNRQERVREWFPPFRLEACKGLSIQQRSHLSWRRKEHHWMKKPIFQLHKVLIGQQIAAWLNAIGDMALYCHRLSIRRELHFLKRIAQ